MDTNARPHRRALLSRYHSFEWEGLKVRVRPYGFRRCWPFSYLPHQTGDEAKLRVAIEGKNRKQVEAFDVVIEKGQPYPLPPHYLKPAYLQVELRPILHFLSQTLDFSGEYKVTIRFLKVNEKGKLEEVHQCRAATIQVKTNIAIAWAIWAIIGGVVGGVVTALIMRLLSR